MGVRLSSSPRGIRRPRRLRRSFLLPVCDRRKSSRGNASSSGSAFPRVLPISACPDFALQPRADRPSYRAALDALSRIAASPRV